MMDPVDFEIISYRLAAATDEMAISLQRAAYSAAAREMMDFSTAICDDQGRAIAQGVGLSIQLGLIPKTMPDIAGEFAEDIHDGDVILLNHPYLCGAHLNDLLVTTPVFHDGELVAFSAAILHHLDVGGRVPGSVAADNRSIFEDGLTIPPIKLVRAGKWDESVVKIFKANVRTPTQNMGDLRAQLAALNTGGREVKEVCKEWGVIRMRTFFAEALRYGEQRSRAEIRALPDGDYAFEDHIDDDGVGGEPVTIHVNVRIRDDEVTVDYTGTDAERACGINSPLNSTRSITYATVRSVLGANVPENAGFYECIDIIAPAGTMVHATHPHAVSSRGLMLYRVSDALHGALAQAAPDRVFAAGDGGALMLVIAGQPGDDEPFVFLDLVSAGWGGRPSADGLQGAAHIGVNHANTPVELIEAELPLRVTRYDIIPDTEGPGTYRGCFTTARDYEALVDCRCVIRGDRQTYRPWGLHGGGSGAPSRLWIRHPDGSETELPTKMVLELKAGDTLCYRTPSGGGWGNPRERDDARVLEDVRDGLVSPDRARSVYGLAVP